MPKITFWRANVGREHSGVFTPFRFREVCERMARLNWETQPSFQLGYGANLLTEVFGRRGTCVTFASVRYDQEVVLAKKGRLEQWHLDTDVGMASLCRAVFFDNNIVGMIKGPSSPSVNGISSFLSEVSGDIHPAVELCPLYKGDKFELLGKIAKFTKIDLKIREEMVHQSPAGPMRKSIEDLAIASGADGSMNIVVQAQRKGRLRHLKQWVNAFMASPAGLDSSLCVVGYDADDARIEIKFADHRFEFNERLPSRPPTAQECFGAIQRLEKEHRASLAKASSFVVVEGGS